ncbi:MAG: hypothetical protein ACREIT_10295 [Tepidisphaeraceae bacterium]
MGLSSNVSLLVASLDLSLVRLLRGAMAPADLAAARANALAHQPVHPERRFESRPVIHPEPHIEPRPVHHPEPRIEPRFVYRPVRVVDVPESDPSIPNCEPAPVGPKHTIQPPWKTVPLENTENPSQLSL